MEKTTTKTRVKVVIKDNCIGNLFKSVRLSKNLSRFQVAQDAQIKQETYRNIEDGKVMPQLQTIINVCRVLQIPQKVLFEHDLEYIEYEDN